MELMELMGALGSPGRLSREQSQPRRDQWLCGKAECKQKPTGPEKNVGMGTEKPIYQEGCESQHGHTHFCTNTPFTLPEETHKIIFLPQTTSLCDFFLWLFDGAFLSEIRGKSE